MAAVLTTTGKQWIVDRMRGTVTTSMQFVHWGTGTVAEVVGNTALGTPSAEARVAGTITSPSAALHRVIATLTSASTQSISEAGLFDASAAGVMLIRSVFTAVPLLAGDSIQFTFDFTQT